MFDFLYNGAHQISIVVFQFKALLEVELFLSEQNPSGTSSLIEFQSDLRAFIEQLDSINSTLKSILHVAWQAKEQGVNTSISGQSPEDIARQLQSSLDELVRLVDSLLQTPSFARNERIQRVQNRVQEWLQGIPNS
jgi:hypothetical protein